MEEKRKYVIGMAYIDRNRCLPHSRFENCIVCEEHCPVPEKAIVFDDEEVVTDEGVTILLMKPRVLVDKCIGCGVCENKCPVKAPAAIIVSPYLEGRAEGGPPEGYGY